MAIVALFATAAYSQTQTAPQTTLRLSIPPRSGIVADFTARVATYVDLRRALEQGLAVRVVTEDTGAIKAGARALAERVRAARVSARQGDIFTPRCELDIQAGAAAPGAGPHVRGDDGRQPG
jgi:hypothetical protein